MSQMLFNLLRTNLFQTILTRSKATFVRQSTNDILRYPWTKDFLTADTRCHFPRPSEGMRIKKHGWKTRMSTPAGRKVLMNRILKGRHVLSH